MQVLILVFIFAFRAAIDVCKWLVMYFEAQRCQTLANRNLQQYNFSVRSHDTHAHVGVLLMSRAG